jgi:hypothetical protein
MSETWQEAAAKRKNFLIRRLIHNGFYTWQEHQLHTQNLLDLEKAYKMMLTQKGK